MLFRTTKLQTWERTALSRMGGATTAVATLAVLLTMLASSPFVSAADGPLAPLARAAALHTLRADSTGEFRMRASVKLFGLVDGERSGEYLQVVQSPAAWFEQTLFPGYTERSGSALGKRWRTRTMATKPWRFHEASMLLDPASHLLLADGATVRSTSREVVGGVQVDCMRVGPLAKLWQSETSGTAAFSRVAVDPDRTIELCFDPASAALRRADYGLPFPSFEYEGELVLGERRFPQTMRCFEGKELAVEATVTELVAVVSALADAAGVPPGAQTWPECAAPQPPRMVAKRPKDSMAYTRIRRQFGTVYFLMEVGQDGGIGELIPMGTRPGMLRLAVDEAAATWRYEPAQCNGVPVPQLVFLAYKFMP
jgi:hypothetical protein